MLHLDVNRFYGEQWASFTLQGLENSFEEIPKTHDSSTVQYRHFLEHLSFRNVLEEQKNQQPNETESSSGVVTNNELEELSSDVQQVSTNEPIEATIEVPISDKIPTPEKEHTPEKMQWTLEKFNKIKRRINIDIRPTLCYSDGAMVQLLRDSNCSRYLEFKAVNRSFVHYEGELIQAPCNREQVFNCKHLKVLEKRIMMKFVTFAFQVDVEGEEYAEWADKGEDELYQSFKLTPGLVKLVKASMVVSSKECLSAHEAIRTIKFYLKNVGVYGSMPFICPVYGAGELPQAFARFSAVFGSIYVLDIEVSDLNSDETNNFSGVTLQTGQKISGKYCIISPNYAPSPQDSYPEAQIRISHAVYLTDSSIKPKSKPQEQDDISVVHILPECLSNKMAVSGYEYGPKSYLPSEDMYMVHLTTPAEPQNNPVTDLEYIADQITENVGILHKTFFSTVMSKEEGKINTKLENNIFRTSRPTFNIGYKDSIDEARTAFSVLYPEEEFMPAAPNPEDIKWPEEDDVIENKPNLTDQAGGKSGELVEQVNYPVENSPDVENDNENETAS